MDSALPLPASGGEGVAPPTTTEQASVPAPAGAEEAATGDLPASLLAEDDDATQADDADAPGDAKQTDSASDYQPFALPDGVTLDEGLLAKAVPILKDLKLDQAGAQKLVSFFAEQRQADLAGVEQSITAAHVAQVQEWQAASRSDKEFGGPNLTKNLGIAKQALKTFGTPELRQLFDGLGISNHPEVIRAFYRVGGRLSEDTLAAPGGATPTGGQRAADIIYNGS
jgi:hypothetical protein